jgi:hypothetical protein
MHNLPSAHAKFRLPGPFDSLVKPPPRMPKNFSRDRHILILQATELHIFFKVFFHASFRILKVSDASVAAVGLLFLHVGIDKLRL